ncbi:MAG: NINE protein [Trueperella sp.]|nr:NINE protein [Trueperella sp.]
MTNPMEEQGNTSGNAWNNNSSSAPIDPNWQTPNQGQPQWQNEQPQWQNGPQPTGTQWQNGQPTPGAPQWQNGPQQWQNPQMYQMPTEQKSQVVAGILGVLLGWLGIHRFYLGYTGIGIAQIAVTLITFGLGGLWGFIEGILILVGANAFRTDARGIPLAQ